MKLQSKKILEPFCGDGTREGEQEEEAAGKTVYLCVFANAPHACPNVKNTESPEEDSKSSVLVCWTSFHRCPRHNVSHVPAVATIK